MATGGTIPVTRNQKVTFFNTTGIIEKTKNIYLVPRFSKYPTSVGHQVRGAFMDILQTVCPPSSAYTNIELSGWSPQDRTLVVRGNIDDFRVVTDEGDCLNYFIIERTVWKEDVDYTYYYAFFITGVKQSGGSSVEISCVPDDFTNVFYLHNKHVLTVNDGDYEPFNEMMKNCYVNRQHYNRVKFVSRTVPDTTDSQDISVEGSPIGARAGISYQLPQGSEIDIDSIYYTADSESVPAGVTLSYSYINDSIRIIFSNLPIGQSATIRGMVLHFNLIYTDVIVPDNMKIFMNQQESFKFKYQYRDLKYPISLYDGNFSYEEIETIESEDTFSNLSQDLRKKILKTCISYLVIETKSTEIACPYYYSNYVTSQGQSTTYVKKRRLRLGQIINHKDIKRPNVVIAVPYLDIPEVFRKYSELSSWGCRGEYNGITLVGANAYKIMVQLLSQKSIAEYIYSVYYTKEVNFPKEYISINFLTKTVDFSLTIPNFVAPVTNDGVVSEAEIKKGCYVGGILQEPIADDSGIDNSHAMVFSFVNGVFDGYINTGASGLIVSGYLSNEFIINVEESIPNLKTEYYDNVLECEPYSFYSLSYLSSYELTFNKNRYYEGLSSKIKIVHYVSFNGAVKEGYIPSYTVDSYESRYYNEGLVFTTSSTMPLVSDSYSVYYYQNQAQMKNQFAVNDYNRGTDLLQHFLVSGPNAVGYSAGRGGMSGGGAGAGAGALLETGNQVMEMVDEGIDWAQSNKVINMNQKAKLADVGAKPDSLKQTGSDLMFDLATNEHNPFLNHYTIDELSYISIAKLYERTGYQVNLYDYLNVVDRVGWNFVKLNGFDWNSEVNIMSSQEDSIRAIFKEGVTLLHDKSYLTSGHNYEKILEEGGE